MRSRRGVSPRPTHSVEIRAARAKSGRSVAPSSDRWRGGVRLVNYPRCLYLWCSKQTTGNRQHQRDDKERCSHAVITNNPQGIQSVGNHPQGAPAPIANLWTSYLFSIAGISGFHIGGGLNYQGKSYSDITNVNSIPPYLIANAAFGYEATHWGIDVNVHNITNERYFIAANAGGALVGQPLSAMVTLRASF